MKYGIKIIQTITEEGQPHKIEYWMRTLSEYVGENNSNLLSFDNRSEAEIYAQNHEISNFEIDTIPGT